MLRIYYPLIGILALAASLQFLHAQSRTTLGEIKKSLACTCACAMTVDACEGSMTCSAAEKLAAEANRMIEEGLGRKMILASFTSRYGEKILAAPTKRGFNLIAWILPFAVTLVGGYSITRILRRWAGATRKAKPATQLSNTAHQTQSEYATRLDGMLRELD